MSSVWLQWVTPDAERQMAYIARGSNPVNQNNPEYEKLFRYCLRNDHWSPFQMASLCVGVETSLAVANQVKRHWSLAVCEPLDIQETSMRYMDPLEHGWDFEEIELRRAAPKDRQSSEEPLNSRAADAIVDDLLFHVKVASLKLRDLGASRECIRMLYPQAVRTRFFLSGSCRSWIHYMEQRMTPHAQSEHRAVAQQLWCIFKQEFPVVANILEGNPNV